MGTGDNLKFYFNSTHIFSYFDSIDNLFFIPLVENFDALETIEQVFLQALRVNAFVRSLFFFFDSLELIHSSNQSIYIDSFL